MVVIQSWSFQLKVARRLLGDAIPVQLLPFFPCFLKPFHVCLPVALLSLQVHKTTFLQSNKAPICGQKTNTVLNGYKLNGEKVRTMSGSHYQGEKTFKKDTSIAVNKEITPLTFQRYGHQKDACTFDCPASLLNTFCRITSSFQN